MAYNLFIDIKKEDMGAGNNDLWDEIS